MTINYTTLLGLAQPVTGTEANTWGTVVNDEITALIEEAIAGGETIDVTSGNVTLTDTDGVANQARNAILIVTGTPGVSRNIVAPSLSKAYIIINGSDGAVVIKGSATTGVTIAAGARSVVAWNGSDFVEVGSSGDVDGPASATDNAIARFDGTTGKIIQNSVVTIADSTGDISGVGTLNATTLDATNLEVTNIKAKDGTAAASIADSTGVVTVSTQLNVDNVRVDGNVISTTNTNGNLTFTADGSGYYIYSGTQAVLVPKGDNTTQRPGTPVTGMLRYNTTSNEFEGYSGSSPAWKSVGGAAISNDTTTATDLYPAYLNATTGTASTVFTSNAQYLFKPSTGELKVKAPVASNGILVNATTMTANYTIATGTNGLSVGPFTIDSGVTLTINSGQRHLIL
jgi:hypothetical protein